MGTGFVKQQKKKQNMMELAKYQKELYQKPRLKYLFLELTDRCNLMCSHCGSNCSKRGSKDLHYTAVAKTLELVAKKYTPEEIMICITGGEPLLNQDIYKYISYSRALGFSVGVTTNATLIGDEEAKRLFEAGLNTVAVSLDGIGETHDKFRGMPGSFEKAWAGCEALRKAGIEPQIISVIHKGNMMQLEEMYQFLKEKGVYSWRLVNMEPIGRANDHADLLLDTEDLKQLFEFIRTKRFDVDCDMDVTYGCSHFVGFEYENEIRDFYFQCGAGTLVASIMADGSIGACLDIERRPDLIQGNVYTDDFCKIWEDRFSGFRRDKTASSGTCSKCKYHEVCLGDSTHTWDFDSNKPRYCVIHRMEEITNV